MELGVVIVVLLALVFDFTNGFHDAANSIATVVSTRVLSPRRAVTWAAFFNGGWRIVKTMGSKITRLQPVGGFAAESAAAVALFYTSAAGIPVSTTHTITGAIVGVGAARRLSAVRWGVAGQVVWAWILTIPGAFAIGWLVENGVRAVS